MTSGSAALRAHAPEVAATLDGLAACVPVDEVGPVVGWVRWVCAKQTSLPPLPGAVSPPTGTSSAAATVEESAQQLAMDVSSVDATQRRGFEELFDTSATTIWLHTYVADWVPRVRHALDRLHGTAGEPGPWVEPELHENPRTIWADFVELTEAVARLRQLDPVTTELVRLRMARQHNCELCKSLRNQTALEAGGAEEDYRELDRWTQSDRFDERTRAALALTDALIWSPAELSDEVVASVRTHFSPPEQTELVLDMLRNAANKVAIASGTDGAHVAEGVEIYDVKESGETVFGLGHLVG